MNISFERVKNKEIHILSRGVIINAGYILLCKSRNLNQNFYFLPGGHIEHKEKAEVALLRELLEEANIKGSIKKFLGIFECVFEPVDDHKVCHTHEYNLIFEVQAENINYKDQVISSENHIEFAWVKLLELENIDLRPDAFIKLIPKWLEIGINQGFESNII